MKRRLFTVEAHSRQRREPRRPQPFNQPSRLIGGRIEQQQFMEMGMPAVPPVGCFRGRHRPHEREEAQSRRRRSFCFARLSASRKGPAPCADHGGP